MARVALMRAANLRPFERFLQRMGTPTERLFERVRLSPDLLHDPEALLPAYAGTAFIAEAARLEGIEHLGATVAAATRIQELGVYGRALAQATSLPELAAFVRRFHAGHHSGSIYWLESSGDRTLACQRFAMHMEDWGAQASQFSIFLAVDALTSIARTPWRPVVYLRKDVPRAVLDTPWAERADLRLGHDRCAIEIDPLVLPMTVPSDESKLAASRELVDWYRTRPADELAPSLRQWLARVLQTDVVRIEVLAAMLGTTPRTLQRRLGEVGTTYARVLGEARFEVATRLLSRDDLEVREVAREVGYRDAAHLTRAFRRWIGTTPSEYRRRVRGALVPTPVSMGPAGANWEVPI